jgi:hypothetical protein
LTVGFADLLATHRETRPTKIQSVKLSSVADQSPIAASANVFHNMPGSGLSVAHSGSVRPKHPVNSSFVVAADDANHRPLLTRPPLLVATRHERWNLAS